MKHLATLQKSFGPTIKKVQNPNSPVSRYPFELKEHVVALFENGVETAESIASALGINKAQVYHWKDDVFNRAQRDSFYKENFEMSKNYKKGPKITRQPRLTKKSDFNVDPKVEKDAQVLLETVKYEVWDKTEIKSIILDSLDEIAGQLNRLDNQYHDDIFSNHEYKDWQKVQFAKGLLNEVELVGELIKNYSELIKNRFEKN